MKAFSPGNCSGIRPSARSYSDTPTLTKWKSKENRDKKIVCIPAFPPSSDTAGMPRVIRVSAQTAGPMMALSY